MSRIKKHIGHLAVIGCLLFTGYLSVSCKENPHEKITSEISYPLTNTELADLVKRHFSDGIVPQTGDNIRVTAYAIAKAESGGNPNATGDVDLFAPGSASIGLWQINTYWNPEYDRQLLFDPDYNAEAARTGSYNGQDWNNWCTWENTACGGSGNRRYTEYLDEAMNALGIND